eukprot:c37098_g1_i1.p1 GENE.c37098_g1_i1~~c37098_g1_i1.p1  ORF type:complete len:167 (+),score=52.86 c37098_g1_i1:34-534(+)
MYSPLQRLNQVFMFSVSLLAVLAVVANFLSLFQESKASVDVTFNNIILNPNPHIDEAYVQFDINADLRSFFTWNTKQLFVYVVAEYKTDNAVRNEVVLWDDIITNEPNSLINKKEVHSEYRFKDKGLRSNNITLSLQWNLLPHSGVLSFFTQGADSRIFPSHKTGN